MSYFEIPMRLVPADEETPFMMNGQYWLLSPSAVHPWEYRIIRLLPSDDGRTPWTFDYETERPVAKSEWGQIVTVFMNEDDTDVDTDHMWDNVDPYWEEGWEEEAEEAEETELPEWFKGFEQAINEFFK